MDLNQIAIFASVVRAGGFSAAARRLQMPKSTVSRKVAELEERVGARLLQRNTRKLGLTDAGRVYYERAARIVGEIEEAERAVSGMQTAPRGLLRVTLPLNFGVLLGRLVAEYLERHREVQAEVSCTDRVVDLVEERFDVAVRAGPLVDSTLVARKLGAIKRVVVASPGYVKERGLPRTPADLAKHDCLVFGAGAAPDEWKLVAGNRQSEVKVRPRLSSNDVDVMHAAARAGVGIAWLPEHVCAADVRQGRLRHLLADWCSAEVPLHALYPTARHLSPKVVAFVDLVAEKLRLHI